MCSWVWLTSQWNWVFRGCCMVFTVVEPVSSGIFKTDCVTLFWLPSLTLLPPLTSVSIKVSFLFNLKYESLIIPFSPRRVNHCLTDRRYLQSVPTKSIESSQETVTKIRSLTKPREKMVRPCRFLAIWNEFFCRHVAVIGGGSQCSSEVLCFSSSSPY